MKMLTTQLKLHTPDETAYKTCSNLHSGGQIHILCYVLKEVLVARNPVL